MTIVATRELVRFPLPDVESGPGLESQPFVLHVAAGEPRTLNHRIFPACD
jgi:hypothetical protein